MDWKIRKLLTIYRTLHPQVDVDRLYVPRSEGGRGLMLVKECIAIETKSLTEYVSKSKGQAPCAVSWKGVLKIKDATMGKTAFQRRERFVAKPLHGQFFRVTEEVKDERT